MTHDFSATKIQTNTDKAVTRAMCSSVAGRYALAIFKVAVQRGTVEETFNEVRVLAKLLEKGQPFRMLIVQGLRNRIKPCWLGDFWKFLEISDETFRFFVLIARNRRIDFLPDVVRLLTMLVNDHLNQVAVCVYTANEISQANKQEISEKIAKIFQKKLNISFEVRESILGGLIVQSNNVTIDVSVNHQIKQFAKIAQNYFA